MHSLVLTLSYKCSCFDRVSNFTQHFSDIYFTSTKQSTTSKPANNWNLNSILSIACIIVTHSLKLLTQSCNCLPMSTQHCIEIYVVGQTYFAQHNQLQSYSLSFMHLATFKQLKLLPE